MAKNMKKTYHLCLSSENEVLFRCHEDFIRGINCLCLLARRTGVPLLAYAFMSNHVHLCVRTDSPEKFMRAFRFAYTRYFNSKYGRSGRLCEEKFFKLEIEGLYHLLTAIAYILRNPMHHGVTSTPFAYPYSSIRALFRRDFGWDDNVQYLPRKYAYHHIPDHWSLPEDIEMDASGKILPQFAIDVADVEHQFATARTFLYYMNRLSGEKWEKEQTLDAIQCPPISLKDIEKGIAYQDLRTMLNNEHGRSNYNAVTDLQLCHEVDNVVLPSLLKNGTPFHIAAIHYKSVKSLSVYTLTNEDKIRLGHYLSCKYHVSAAQIRRCLVLPYAVALH